MLYFDRIDVSEGTDVNKTSASKECDICHYWYFLNHSSCSMFCSSLGQTLWISSKKTSSIPMYTHF